MLAGQYDDWGIAEVANDLNICLVESSAFLVEEWKNYRNTYGDERVKKGKVPSYLQGRKNQKKEPNPRVMIFQKKSPNVIQVNHATGNPIDYFLAKRVLGYDPRSYIVSKNSKDKPGVWRRAAVFTHDTFEEKMLRS